MYYYDGVATSYVDAYDKITRIACWLDSKGIQKGNRVAVILPNSPQFVLVAHAVWSLGATLVALNQLYTSRELMFQLQNSCSKVAFVLDIAVEKVTSADIEIVIASILLLPKRYRALELYGSVR